MTRLEAHFKKHRNAYVGIAVGIGIGLVMTRCLGAESKTVIGDVVIGDETNVIAGHNNILNQVSYIDSLRQGPPSWVVRCLETGEVFTSQKAAAKAMGISASHLSRHLHGNLAVVRGYTFERICMAA
jgi:hypothetical protein